MNTVLIHNCIVKQIAALISLKSTVRSDDYTQLFEIMTETLQSGHRIWICGVGKNANIATKISESMASLGIRSGYMDATNYAHGDAGFIEVGDMVLYISRSGRTGEITYMAKHLKLNRPEMKQILIYANEDFYENENINALPYYMTIFLKGVVEGDINEIAPTTSTTAFLCFLDTLTVALSYDLGFKKEDFLKFHPGGNLGQILQEK